jgi:hypothetical protein
VCPSMGTDIEVGPTGRTLIPIAPVSTGSPITNTALADG